ncbi:MAG: hypothetical protein M0R32_12170 [Candidatus Cloacimonetes bacterium]|nr:hypothetical protein [Candidatus Cloacimonadota bacterium]
MVRTKKDRRPKLETGWRYLEAEEFPIPGDEMRHKGERYWERNYLNHDHTPAGSYLWGNVYWKRRIELVKEEFVRLTDLPEYLERTEKI